MVEYDLEKITEEQAAELENDFDDIEAPPGPYTIQPENQGNETMYLKCYKHMQAITNGEVICFGEVKSYLV